MNTLGWIVVVLALLCALYLWLIAPARKRPDDTPLRGWLYAHRGLHDGNKAVAENSLEAFRGAVEAGYGMELDVQLTRDQQLVVFHDPSLKRVCGVAQKLCTLTYAELLRIPLPGGSHIPLFSEVLALVDGRAPMIVEIKFHYELGKTAEATLQALRGYAGAYCVESFHPLAVRYFKRHAPDIVRGQLAYGGRWMRSNINGIQHFAMKHLLGNAIGRPHFIAYSVPSDHTLGMWLMKRVFHPLLAAWTIRDQQTLERTQSVYDYPIFELFAPEPAEKPTAVQVPPHCRKSCTH
ncbi:MAG: glycerophosphodiester phosphodiesterase family protein [Clostridia bacterium]